MAISEVRKAATTADAPATSDSTQWIMALTTTDLMNLSLAMKNVRTPREAHAVPTVNNASTCTHMNMYMYQYNRVHAIFNNLYVVR